MKFYIHPINPHISAEHHDTYMEGWHYGIWEYDYPAIAPHLYRFQSQHLEAAQDTQKKAQDASKDFSDMPETNKYEFHGADPFSAQAAIVLAQVHNVNSGKIMPNAFIDDGQIKILNEEGAEYSLLVEGHLYTATKHKRLFALFTVLFVLFTAFTVYLSVFTDTSFIKAFIPGVMAFASLVFLDNYRVSSYNQGNFYHQQLAKFNLAKTQLQPQIMKLQKELAQHEADMSRIRNQDKFNFKKDMEGTMN